VQYVRDYHSRVAGTKVYIYCAYDNKDVLIEPLKYDQFTINGATFTSAAAVQEALLPVIYSRGTLGSDVSELLQDNRTVKVNVIILASDDLAAIAAKINALPSFTIDEFQIPVFVCQTAPGAAEPRYAVAVFNNKGKGTYGAGGTTIAYADLILISDRVNESPVINQDNITVRKTIIMPVDYSQADVAAAVNAAPIFPRTDIQNLLLITPALAPGEFSFTQTKLWIVINKGKGTYGVGGTVSLASADVQWLADITPSAADIEDDPNTQTVNYGAIVSPATVASWLTAKNPAIVIQEQTIGIRLFKGTVNGVVMNYIFTAAGGTYGVGHLPATMADFELYDSGETPGTPSTLDDITSNGNITPNPITVGGLTVDDGVAVYTMPSKTGAQVWAFLSDLVAKLTGNMATDAETQISSAVTEDSKYITRLKLFNWSISEPFRGRVRGILLAGLSLATGTDITAADSIIIAFGKLQAQLTALRTTAQTMAANWNFTADLTRGSEHAITSGATSTSVIKRLILALTMPGTPDANALYLLETAEFFGPVSVAATASVTVNIPHGQSFTPSFYSVQAKNTLATGTFSVGADATNIILTYTTARTAGTADYMVQWKK